MIVRKDSVDYYGILKGEKCVFINGCFDIFHLEHLRMINFARDQFPGHKLIMAINSDNSIKAMGKSHPLIFNETYRSEFLNELADLVVIYDEYYDYLDIIKDFKPSFIIKGSEYQHKEIPEKRIGINIIYYFGKDGTSSTEVYKKIIKKFKDATEI
jgi:D-beta-D-heptose 7-phosphate kinase/D-beta-D-heptose 1-phosphate adenosyltransferase